MSWHYIPGRVADCLERNYLGSRLSAMWRTDGIALMYSKPGSQVGFWTTPRSGMMPEHLTGSPGLDWWMYLQRASHASRFQSQESSERSLTSATCGRTPFASLEKLGQDGAYWKMSLASLPGLMDTLDEYCETWPRAGMIVDGTAYQREPLAPRTKGTGCGLFVPEATYPTPNTLDHCGSGRADAGGNVKKWNGLNSLGAMAAKNMWPTPSANKITPNSKDPDDIVDKDGNPIMFGQKPHDRRTGKPVQTALADAVRWPTPTSRDHKDTGDAVRDGKVPVNGLLGRQVGPSKADGSLNPDWVEWLMGWPVGWSDVDRVPEYDNWINGEQSWEHDPADSGEMPRATSQKANRVNRLKAIGNGQVPLCVVVAWELLAW